MAKTKQKQKTNNNNNSSSKFSEWDPELDDNWVMVKKQKITILIPALPVTKQVPIANPGESNPQTILPRNTTKEKSKSTPLTATSVQQVPNLIPNLIPNQKVTILRTKNRRGICCKYGGVMVNNSIRAMNVERKLRRAGGLKRWLLSMGLDEFVRIFEGKCVGKFHLVNLTMKKLKDMGVVAVGPRRKLIHALDCICQPGCFEFVCE